MIDSSRQPHMRLTRNRREFIRDAFCGFGGGVQGGQTVGATDPIGLRAIESPYHFRDVHTTLLHQLGLDQHQLTFPHLGRNERLTFVEGNVIREIV